MQKADFEKNVQEKMQELRFQPSQEVWKHVEAGITPQRRRRPMVIWFLFAGLLLAGGSFYFINTSSNKNISANKHQQPGQAIAGKQQTITEKENNSNGTAPENALSSAENKKPVGTSEPSTIDLAKSKRDRTNKKQDQILPLKPKESQQEKVFIKEDWVADAPASFDQTGVEPRTFRATIPIEQQSETSISYFGKDILGANETTGLNLSSEPVSASTSKNNPPVKKMNWQFGVTAAGGIADLGDQLLQSASAANLYFDPLQSPGGGAVRPKPSEVEKGAFFSLGAFANKTLGRKWKLGLGLGYQYYSNTIKVGEKVDSTAFVNQNNFSLDRVNQYYKSAGNNPYHNQYHFISLPINVQWQFAKHFTWENGVIAARMFKTNALHYDGVSGRYYEDDDLFNKYQLSASTAVLFAFHKNKIQVGPQFQYVFTNLMKPSTGNPKHLRSVSIKANIELWKN